MIIPTASAQGPFGEKAIQKSVEVFISSNGDVHVKHVIKNSSGLQELELIDGEISNIVVTNEDGNKIIHGTAGENIVILPSNEKSILEYDLKGGLLLKNDIWYWDFFYPISTSFFLPDEVNLFFVNNRPVYLNEKEGMICHGCQMILEYALDEPKTFQNVKWEDKEFLVEIRSFGKINEFNFSQPTKTLSFQVDEENNFVTTLIPLELLGNPYSVFLDEEKIFYHEYINNGTHVWLNVRPDTAGNISIIGTTVIPEFPLFAPLAIGFLIIVFIPYFRKFNLR